MDDLVETRSFQLSAESRAYIAARQAELAAIKANIDAFLRGCMYERGFVPTDTDSVSYDAATGAVVVLPVKKP